MRKYLVVTTILVTAVIFAARIAAAEPGPVKITAMERVETHSKIYDGGNDFSGETYNYFMLTAYRELQKNTVGSVFYLNRYSFDESDFITHIGGVSVIHAYNPRVLSTISYSHTSNPERSTIIINPRKTRDRMSVAVIYNVNPKRNANARWSLTSAYNTVTDWGEQRTLTEKLEVKFPKVTKRLEAKMAYTFSYGLSDSDQYTNQYSSDLSFRFSKTSRLVLGVLFIDNVYENNQGDDTVFRLSLVRNIR